jgi:hypothetical protein
MAHIHHLRIFAFNHSKFLSKFNISQFTYSSFVQIAEHFQTEVMKCLTKSNQYLNNKHLI